jgi:hypothetical protein
VSKRLGAASMLHITLYTPREAQCFVGVHEYTEIQQRV